LERKKDLKYVYPTLYKTQAKIKIIISIDILIMSCKRSVEKAKSSKEKKQRADLEQFLNKRQQELGWLSLLPNEILREIALFCLDILFQLPKFCIMPEPFPSFAAEEQFIQLTLQKYQTNPISHGAYTLYDFCACFSNTCNLTAKRNIASALLNFLKKTRILNTRAKKQDRVIVEMTIGNQKWAKQHANLAENVAFQALCYIHTGLDETHERFFIDHLARPTQPLSYDCRWSYVVESTLYYGDNASTRYVLARPRACKIHRRLFTAMYKKDRALLIEHKHLWNPEEYGSFRYFAKDIKNDQELYDLIPKHSVSSLT